MTHAVVSRTIATAVQATNAWRHSRESRAAPGPSWLARILPIEQATATEAAQLRADAADKGRTLQLADALIAGTAIQHRLTIATRNTRDFDDGGVAAFDPWSG